MRKFLIKLSYFCLPIIFVLVITIPTYIFSDPFRDFTKDKVSWTYRFQQLGDINTKNLINSDIDYNSFILGSSRSVSINACYLQHNIPNSKFFHYANWNETIGGIYSKLHLLDKKGYKLENIVIYIDTDCTFKNDGEGRMNDHYLLTNQSRFSSYLQHIKTYYQDFDIDRFKILIGRNPSNHNFPNWQSDANTNDPNSICNDSLVNNYGLIPDSLNYYHIIDSLVDSGKFYSRPRTAEIKESQISDQELQQLISIKELLTKHQSNYYIIITPLYDQIKISPSDTKILKRLFTDNLYDFSGINQLTNNYYNYKFDASHFNDFVSKEICDSVILNNLFSYQNNKLKFEK